MKVAFVSNTVIILLSFICVRKMAVKRAEIIGFESALCFNLNSKWKLWAKNNANGTAPGVFAINVLWKKYISTHCGSKWKNLFAVQTKLNL